MGHVIDRLYSVLIILCIDSVSNSYLSPMRPNTGSGRKASRETQRGASTKDMYGSTIPWATSPPRVEIPYFMSEEKMRTPPNNSNPSDYLSASMKTLPPIPLTPATPDSSSFFDTSELFDAFPSVPQNLPSDMGTSLLSGFELGAGSDPRHGEGLANPATISSNYRSTFRSYR